MRFLSPLFLVVIFVVDRSTGAGEWRGAGTGNGRAAAATAAAAAEKATRRRVGENRKWPSSTVMIDDENDIRSAAAVSTTTTTSRPTEVHVTVAETKISQPAAERPDPKTWRWKTGESSAPQATGACSPCDVRHCPNVFPADCGSGNIVKDACNCCPICVKDESDSVDTLGYSVRPAAAPASSRPHTVDFYWLKSAISYISRLSLSLCVRACVCFIVIFFSYFSYDIK